MNWTVGYMSVASLIVAFVSLYLAYRSVVNDRKSIATLAKVREGIDKEVVKIEETSDRTQQLIARMAELFDASERAGLEMIYPDRNTALAQFGQFLDKEKDEVIIIGSSLLGLSLFVPGFEDMVCKRPRMFRFLLTHPDVSQNREGPEERDPNVIRGEILEAIHKLKKWGVPVDQIQLYKGSPSVFMIVASGHMLLNPYPYGTEAYRCFCIQVSERGTVYTQYLKKHFQKVWDSAWVEKCADFLKRNRLEGTDSVAAAENPE